MTETGATDRGATDGGEGSHLDFNPVPPEELEPAHYFAGNYAGEHVAGTEFVIGALFVAAGATAGDILVGLIIGNTLAVLTWAMITAPIAVDTRLSLYAYLQKVARPGFVKVYSVVNGIMFLGLAGSMITVSASAVRILYNSVASGEIEPQTGIFPTDFRFVLVALVVGAVIVTLAAIGFRRLAQFAEAVAPWMIAMFLIGAFALYPQLALEAGLTLPALAPGDIWTVLSQQVYEPKPLEGPFWAIPNEARSVWSIAAFAWVVNLAHHGALGDMSLLRFARNKSYGWFSALGMFIGHFGAWICAGIMGAGAAVLVGSSITALDSGSVAFQALGSVGILAVVIAGWTTSNPTLYRAGLAFQSINPKWSRQRVTIVVGVVTMIVACSPFVFSQLLAYVGWMGLTLAPVGAILTTEHWILPRVGLTRYWASYREDNVNLAALGAWIAALALIFVAYFGLGIHQFFLLVPAWIIATVAYVALAAVLGAGSRYDQAAAEEKRIQDRVRAEREYLERYGVETTGPQRSAASRACAWITWAALAWGIVAALWCLLSGAETYPDRLASLHGNLERVDLDRIRDSLGEMIVIPCFRSRRRGSGWANRIRWRFVSAPWCWSKRDIPIPRRPSSSACRSSSSTKWSGSSARPDRLTQRGRAIPAAAS